MKDMMHHRGYYGSVHYDDDDEVFYGKVEFVRALVSYEGTDVKKLRRAFEEAVDDYLDLCSAKGRDPDRPFKGSFNVRVGQHLHRRAAVAAAQRGVSLNRFVAQALEKATRDDRVA